MIRCQKQGSTEEKYMALRERLGRAEILNGKAGGLEKAAWNDWDEKFSENDDDDERYVNDEKKNCGDDDHDGLPAYSHHDKIPPWLGNVSNNKGGNVKFPPYMINFNFNSWH